MVSVRMMKAPVDDVVDVIAMRHRLMSATRPMHMARFMLRRIVGRAARRVGLRYRNYVLDHFATFLMVQVPVMNVVHMVAVADRGVPAARTVGVGVIAVMMVVGHALSFCTELASKGSQALPLACSRALVTRYRT